MHYSDEETIALIAEKNAIESGHYVFGCEYTSTPGIRKVRRCYDELIKIGATVEIYEDGELTSRKFISNLIESYQEIEQETQDMIDAEVEATGDED